MNAQGGHRSVYGRAARVVAVVAASVVGAGLLTGVAHAQPAQTPTEPKRVSADRPVPGKPLAGKPRTASPPAKPAPEVRWPKAGAAEAALGERAGRWARAGKLPVSVRQPKSAKADTSDVGALRVRLLSRGKARQLGVDGVVFILSPSGGGVGDRVDVSLDYSGFGHAYGGDYGNRLGLVRLPACALATPAKAQCRRGTPIASSRNDTKAERLSAEVQPPVSEARVSESDAVMVLAATSGDASDKGDYKATSLSPSAQWQVSEQTGDFGWSYSARVPPVPGGLAPTVKVGYSSGSVDGRTSNTNNQPSWLGEGFEFSPGFIERRYKPCADDGTPTDEWGNKPGDQCWAYDNATVTWNGKGGELIKADDGLWRLKNDDGTRFQKFASTARGNGDNSGEYWRVTTTDGSRFYFGYNRLPGWASGDPETNSTWTAPVFGDDDGEPCHGATFAESWCHQAWRWNLDYVVDPHGNAVAYHYKQEENYYARNLKVADETRYVRGGWLDRIDYGLRSSDMFSPAPARVVFTDSERCIPTDTFDCDPSKISTNPDKWPDVPWDLNCKQGADCQNVSPSFWTRKRLTKITTRVLDAAGAYRDVESWGFAHKWGDADVDRALLLTSITHTGHAADPDVPLPPVTFTYTKLLNRVDKDGDDILPFIKYRLGSVSDESGGTIDVNYSSEQCALDALPAPESNTKRCFPVYWTPQGREDPIRDWFHKYVVTQVIRTDRTGGAPDMISNYTYEGGAAWHYDTDDGITKEKHKTWGQWRGYGKVRVETGGVDDGMLTRRDTLYLRGMHGDRASPSGGERDVTVSDGEGGTHYDYEALAGFELKTTVLNGPAGDVVEKTVNTPWKHITATRIRPWGTTRANLTGAAVAHTWTALEDGTWRETEIANTYETVTGRVVRVSDKGANTTLADNRCTRTSYAEDTSTWKLSYIAEEETVAVTCSVTPDRSTDVISHTRLYYDGQALSAAPTKGDITKTEQIATHDGATATFVPAERSTYDAYGRVVSSTDPEDHTTTTSYTETSGLTTQATVTSPPVFPGDATTSHVTVTDLDPAWGEPVKVTDPNNLVTNLAYDALGRLRKVWLPDRSTTSAPTVEFSYRIVDGAPVAIGTKEINASGGQMTEAFQLFDGWLRPRQTQAPGPDGGRLISDTFYDSRGSVSRVYDTYYATSAPTTAVFAPDGGNVETQIGYDYDGLNRVVVERLLAGTGGATEEKWRTVTAYGGDRVHLTPPDGAAPTTTINDARGQTTELRHYKGSTPSGDYVSTKYTHTPAGQLKTVTDPAGNTWSYEYDLRGRKTLSTDPDSGATRYDYNDRDLLIWTEDAEGRKVYHTYDPLGRETETRSGTADGPLLTTRLWDTLRKGQLTAATRHVDGRQYVTRVDAYDRLYRPIRTTVTIPEGEGLLAGSYQFNTRYRIDGLLQSTGFPSAGGMSGEAVVYTYDDEDLGRPIRLTGSGSFTYVNNTLWSLTGKLEQLELTAGGRQTQITNSYEHGTQRLSTSRVDRVGINGVDRNATYAYDDAGNVLSISDVSRNGTDTQCFDYDYLRRLIEAWTQGTTDCATAPSDEVIGGLAPYRTSYGYDDAANEVGNRKTETRHGLGGAADTVRDYSYPTSGVQPHKLTSVAQTGPGGSRTDTFDYDDTGNTTQRIVDGKTQALTWDVEGRLAKVTEDAGDTTFLYDADGNRLIRRDPAGATLYLPGMELRLDDGAAATKATRYYQFAGQTVAVRTPDGVSLLVSDHHGTAELAIDPATDEVTQRRFDPFGNERSLTGLWPSEKGFVGGTKDPTGLTHLGAREYDPQIGRFISVDPLIDFADPVQMHGYAYADNSPVTLSDPTGLIREGGTDPNTGEQILDPDPGGNKGSGSGKSGGGSKCGEKCRDERLGGETFAPEGVGRTVNYYAYEGWGKPFHELTPEQKRYILQYTACSNNGHYSKICEAFRFARPQNSIEAFLGDVLGVNDVKDCGQGSASGCGWLILGLIPVGKFLKAFKAIKAAKAGDKLAAACKVSSFVPGTLVLMADGSYKPIEEVQVGDEVIATDPETGETTAKPVIALITSQGFKNLVEITVDTDGDEGDAAGVVIATDNHPFWVDNQGSWVDAIDLEAGDLLRAPAGDLLPVIATHEYPAYQQVHNLSVGGIHTYHVASGDQPVLVHNSGPGCEDPLPTQKSGRTKPLTTQQAADLAKYLGFKRTNYVIKGERVFTDGKWYIVQDTTSHNGGTWKIAHTAAGLRKKQTRTATTDALLNLIGD